MGVFKKSRESPFYDAVEGKHQLQEVVSELNVKVSFKSEIPGISTLWSSGLLVALVKLQKTRK